MASQVSSNWRVGAIVLIFFVVGQALHLHQRSVELRNVFHFDVEVTLVDSVTGELIKNGTTHGPSSSSRDPIQQTTTYLGGEKIRRISGVGIEPREFGFSAPGYNRKDLLVAEDTKSAVTIALDPINGGVGPN